MSSQSRISKAHEFGMQPRPPQNTRAVVICVYRQASARKRRLGGIRSTIAVTKIGTPHQ